MLKRLGRGAVRLLGQSEQRDGADEGRTDGVTGGAGLLDAAKRALGARDKDGAVGDLRDEVVVVRVEPLGHLERGLGIIAASEGEFLGEGNLFVGAEDSDGERGLEHVVVDSAVSGDGVVLVQAGVAKARIRIYTELAARKSSSLARPDHRASSANLSSRWAPMRG